MIARSNLDLLSALAQASAAQNAPISVPVAQNQRFDAALLQAAKAVKDGHGQGAQIDNTLTPKVEQALESLLDQLSQQPEEQVRQLAKQPELLKPAVEALTQTYALDPEEAKALATAVPLLTKGLAQALDSLKAEAAKPVEIAAPGKISGPQGGEPGTTSVDPVETLKPEAPVAQAPVQTDKRERSTDVPATLAPAMVWAPAIVSTRTDSGSNADSQVSLASRPVESASAPVSPSPISVNVSPSVPVQSVNTNVAEPAPPQSIAPVQAQAPVVLTTVSRPQAPQVEQAPSATEEQPQVAAPSTRPTAQAEPVVLASEGSATPKAVAPAAAQAPQSTNQAPVQRSNAPAKSDAPVAKSADEQLLDFKVASSNTPSAPVREESVFILNGDGSTQGAQQVAAPQPQTVAPLASSNSPKPEVAQVAPQAPAVQATQSPVASSPVVFAAPVKAEAALTPTNAAVPVVQAPMDAQQSAAPVVVPNAPVATPNIAVNVDGQRPLSESSSAPVKTAQATSSAASFEPQALENSAGFQALAHSSQEDAPQTGFGFGQSTLRQVLNQVAKELGVQEAAFTQVSEALAATGKETSRLLIKLKPASLGEVQVDLGMEGGKLTARLVASSAEVRDAFVRDLPAFKASLETQGIKIDQVSVAVRAGNDFNPQGQGQAQQQPQGFWGTQADAAVPSFSAPVTQAAWAPTTANDQLFSALA